jgi:hypothetical protein
VAKKFLWNAGGAILCPYIPESTTYQPMRLFISHQEPKTLSIVKNGGGSTWDRCYDFVNIFAEKFSEHFCIFCSNCC